MDGIDNLIVWQKHSRFRHRFRFILQHIPGYSVRRDLYAVIRPLFLGTYHFALPIPSIIEGHSQVFNNP